eukprot:6955-Heterococcus_DN1.PRE.1
MPNRSEQICEALHQEIYWVTTAVTILVSYMNHTHMTSVLGMRLLLLLSLLGVAQAKLRGSQQAEAEDDLAPARALAQSCANNGGCMNDSTCKLNSVGLIWCMNCPTGYSGDRCERAPASATGKQSCTPPVTGGACQNGSQCKLNSAGYIYCTGEASQQPSNEAVHARLVKLSTSVLTLWCLSTALHVVYYHQAVQLGLAAIDVRYVQQALLLSRPALLL